jgi:predicted amidohydrolase
MNTSRKQIRRLLLAACVTLMPQGLVSAQELIPPSPAGWTAFAPRTESAPAVNASPSGSGYTLNVAGNNVQGVYGGWRTRIQGLHGGNHYRFRARALPTNIASIREAVSIVLRWRGAFGDEVSPDYVWEYQTQTDGSVLFDRILRAPSGTSAVDVELVLQWAPTGHVAFDALSFTPAAPPAARPVRVAAIYYRPSGSTSGLDSVQRAARFAEQIAAAHGPDVMVLGELLNVIGAPGSYDAKAETIPGPSTDVMAGVARGYGVNVAFGMLERDGSRLYNTAVLIDRDGAIAGKYRKVQVPLNEASGGISPGESVPVFQTDFGRVALLICQDTFFPEPAREAAVKGAELLLVPIWGGKPALVRTRALEHGMYVAASGYDYASEVVGPLGNVLDSVTLSGQPDVAVADIDLSQRFRELWLGDWRDISNKERRLAPYRGSYTPGDPPTPPPDQTPPVVALTSPASGASVSGSITVAATASDNVGVAAVRFLLDGAPLGADDTAAPYSLSWDTTTVTSGTHTLGATAFDAAGNSTSSSTTVTVSNGGGSTPFTGTPIALPGRIEAERFDNGGANIAYRDNSAGNSGGQYRQTDVDIAAAFDTGSGYTLGWMGAGEWLNYTVDVAAAGSYTVRVRVASAGAGGVFHIETGGADRTGPITIPNTGGWQAWTTIPASATLPAGRQVLRVVLDTNSAAGVFGNINWIEVVPQAAGGSTPFGGMPLSLPGRIEVENFDNGGTGVAYADNSAGNSGGWYRQTDVDIEATADTGGGYDVGWMGAGEWLKYTVTVATAGTYTVRARVAVPGGGGTFHIESNGVDRTGPITIPNTGGWQTWVTISATANLPAGQQVLRLVLDANGSGGLFGNMNWLEVAPAGGAQD